MIAIGLVKDKPGVQAFDIPKPHIKEADEVLIKVKEVGIDGTDINMVKHDLKDFAKGRQRIVGGHEMVGVVEEVGKDVTSIAPGDVVCATVRRGCGICAPCLHNQSDMCLTGLYTERGIHKRDGFMTEFVVDEEQYIIKVPPKLAPLAVFTEPLSIAEKGIEQIRTIQARLPWACAHPEHHFQSPDWGNCKTALVIGAGPLGLLATALLRLAEVITYATDILPEDNPRIRLLKHTGATYIDARKKTPAEIAKLCRQETNNLDMIFEASGAAATALELINYMSRSSIYVMTGIPREEILTRIDAAQLVRQIVRFNQVIVGSVNSNRSHFEMALNNIPLINSRFDNMLGEMITRRLPLKDYEKAFIADPGTIKTVFEMSPW